MQRPYARRRSEPRGDTVGGSHRRKWESRSGYYRRKALARRGREWAYRVPLEALQRLTNRAGKFGAGSVIGSSKMTAEGHDFRMMLGCGCRHVHSTTGAIAGAQRSCEHIVALIGDNNGWSPV